jgi:sugar lactone lactonase YvrE
VVGSGFGEHTDPAALVVGPTGLGLGRDGTLYVADTVSNRIAAIPNALHRSSTTNRGRTVTMNGALNSPLGLTIAPNGNVLTMNGGDGNLVETTPSGTQVTTRMLDSSGTPPGAGALFGLAIAPHGRGLYFVDDADNTLDLLTGHSHHG